MKIIRRSFGILIVIATMFFSNNISAQKRDDSQNRNNNAPPEAESSYKSALGLRGGFESGITFKHFISGDRALEFILSAPYHYRGYRITGLYEIQKPIPGAGGLNWFCGAGAHFGSYDYGYYGWTGWNGYGYYDKHGVYHTTGYAERYAVFGIDLIIGLEYKFESVPFTLGLDLKPFFDFMNRGDHYTDGAFTLRYVFK